MPRTNEAVPTLLWCSAYLIYVFLCHSKTQPATNLGMQRYNEVKLGSFEFELYPAKHKNGVNIDSLRLLSSEFDIDGSGYWLVTGKQEQFDLNGGFKSEDLTGALKVFGYDNDLTSGKTEITYDVSWQ